MKKETIVRAWRDRDAYLSLSAEERAQLPAHPAGVVDLRDEDLAGVAGAAAGTHYSHCEVLVAQVDDAGGMGRKLGALFGAEGVWSADDRLG
ncbi:MAG: mersacidin/lichenicidin family type 2 lantibiotic, partial [Acidobacteriota bacterium]